MKKIIILSNAFILLTFASYSQTKTGGVYIKGGVNLANISTTSDGRIDDAKTLTSFHVGVMGDAPLGDFFSIQPSLLLTGKGSKTQRGQSGEAFYYKATSNPLYVELPVNFVFKIPAGDKIEIFVGAGPYVAVGVGGKNKIEGTAGLTSFNSDEKIKFSNDDPTTFNEQEGAGLSTLRRFDFGLNATAGLELDKFLISLNYGYGLTKINSVAKNDDDKNKYRVLGLSIGFKL